MNKSELVEAIASRTKMSKAASEVALNSTIEAITETLSKGGSVQLIGFGNFGTGKVAARQGKNPRTGQTINIPARTKVKFSAGKALKGVVNGEKRAVKAAPKKSAKPAAKPAAKAAKPAAKASAKPAAKAAPKKSAKKK